MSGAYGVASEKPHCHPGGSLTLESIEGCAEKTVCYTFVGAHHQHVMSSLLTPFATRMSLLSGYLICVCVSFIMVDTLKTICLYKPFSSFFPVSRLMGHSVYCRKYLKITTTIYNIFVT
jgi:hypothetical protein